VKADPKVVRMIQREYEYRLKVERVMFRAALVGVGALWFGWMALTNDRGLVVFVVPLSAKNATVFYAVFAALAGFYSAYDFTSVSRRGSLRQRIAFTEDALIVPRSLWRAEEDAILYRDVLDFIPFSQPDTLTVIRHRGGEFSLRLDMLPDERAYTDILQNLALLVRAAGASVSLDESGGPTPGP
jgi:hypothetical protein